MKLLILLITCAIVMLLLVTLAGFLERYWRAYQAQRSTAKEGAANQPEGIEGTLQQLAASVAAWVVQMRAKVQPESNNDVQVKVLRAWVTRELNAEKELQSWLLALPEPGFALLTKHIAAFCTEMNFDLNWLAEAQLTVTAELKAAMKAIIVDYCRACKKAIPVQEEARLFTYYRRLLQQPQGRQEQALSRTLYANLTASGVIAAPDAATLINATDVERQQQARTAIQQAATRNWPQFAKVLQATITPNGNHANGASGHSNITNASQPASPNLNGASQPQPTTANPATSGH